MFIFFSEALPEQQSNQLEEENEALQFCFASPESAHTVVEYAKVKVVEQIKKGWWHPRDLMKNGMRLNVLDPIAPTPWVMCWDEGEDRVVYWNVASGQVMSKRAPSADEPATRPRCPMGWRLGWCVCEQSWE